MSEAQTVCDVPSGPNCGLCRCKLDASHVGQHENWHGSKWGESQGPRKATYAELEHAVAMMQPVWDALVWALAADEPESDDWQEPVSLSEIKVNVPVGNYPRQGLEMYMRAALASSSDVRRSKG